MNPLSAAGLGTKNRALLILSAALLTLGVYSPSRAQDIVAARAGLIYSVDGDVRLNGEELVLRPSRMPLMERGELLRVGSGSANVLLNPGAYLAMEPDSAVRLVESDLTDTRVQLVAGRFRLRCCKIRPDLALTIMVRDAEVRLLRTGELVFDASETRLRVVRGTALVRVGNRRVTVRAGETVHLSAA